MKKKRLKFPSTKGNSTKSNTVASVNPSENAPNAENYQQHLLARMPGKRNPTPVLVGWAGLYSQ